MMKFITSLMIINSILFMTMNHPLSMGMILLNQTILCCLLTGFYSKSFWFSYILFLIFIGGMLVIFIYMSSLTPNEKLFYSWKNFLITFNMLFIVNLSMLLWDSMLFMNLNNLETMTMSQKLFKIEELLLNTTKIYLYPNNLTTIMMIIYLLLTLIIVVKITSLNNGPLRKKN